MQNDTADQLREAELAAQDNANLGARDSVTLASQRPAYAAYPPALTRHMLFRIPEDQQPHYQHEGGSAALKDNASLNDAWRRLLEPINDYVRACHAAFETDCDNRFWIRAIDGDRQPNDTTKTSESLLCCLQDREGFPRFQLRVDVHTETYTITHIADRIPAHWEAARRIASASSPEEIDWLYRRFWEDAKVGWPAPPAAEPRLRKPVAEFRGVVLATHDRPFVKTGAEPFFDPHPHPTPGRLSPGIHRFLEERDAFVRNLVKTRPKQGPSPTTAGASVTEAVVCGMLDGQALYASPLANTPGIVRYLLAYDGSSPAQLGRFVRRMHIMGELRLSALFDFSAPVGKSVRQVGQGIRNLGRRVDEAMQSEAPLKAGEVRKFSQRLGAISRLVSGGIAYRSERSRYYASAFQGRIRDLRIVPIEGWQPYDAFVQRYLSQEYSFIASVGERFKTLGSRIDRLMFLHQSEISEDTFSQLKDLQQKGETLQLRAEDIAILAGIYYGSQSIFHMIERESAERALTALTGWLRHAPPVYEAVRYAITNRAAGLLYVAGVSTLVLIVDTLFFKRRLRRRLLRLTRAAADRLNPKLAAAEKARAAAKASSRRS